MVLVCFWMMIMLMMWMRMMMLVFVDVSKLISYRLMVLFIFSYFMIVAPNTAQHVILHVINVPTASAQQMRQAQGM